MKKTIITVVGKDTVGIIAKICTYLAENQVNILLKNFSFKYPLDVAIKILKKIKKVLDLSICLRYNKKALMR